MKKGNEMDNEKKAQEVIQLIAAMLAPIPRNYDIKNDPGFWYKDGMILCPSEVECEVVAEFFRDVLREFSGLEVLTGSHDPHEMREKAEQGTVGSFYCIRFKRAQEDSI